MTARATGATRAQRVLLLVLLVVATALRFSSLDWGLRHPPHPDERVFVRNAGLMLAAGDLDHRYYEYPGLFVYLLAATLAGTGAREGAAATLAGRALVAGFGVASVLLAYRLGRRQAGAACGLLAAALLAVSPVEVRTAHMIRPDVVLESFVLLGLLALAGLDGRMRRALLAGAALGAATAVKFSGALLLPSLVMRALALESRRLRTLAVAGLAAFVAFATLSPYTLLGRERAASGLSLQLGYFFLRRPAADLSGLAVEARYFAMALGVGGALLALVGLFRVRHALREWAPVAALPLLFAVVFSMTTGRAERYILPSFGAAAVLAGFAFEAAWRRAPGWAAVLALLVLAPPAVESLEYLAALRQPRTQDLVADWLTAHLPPGARVRNSIDTPLGLPDGLEQVFYSRAAALDPRLGRGFDAVVTGIPAPGGREPDGRVAFEAVPTTPFSGPGLQVRLPDPARLQALPLDAVSVAVSGDEPARPGLSDGDLATGVAFAQPGSIEIDLGGLRPLARLELVTPDREAARAEIDVLVRRSPGAEWLPFDAGEGRPGLEEQQGVASRVLLFDGTPLAAVTLRVRPRRAAFTVAELRLDLDAP